MEKEDRIPDEPLVTDLLREVLGSDLHVTGYQPILQREDYAVLIAHLVDPAPLVVMKLAGPRATLAAPFDRTLAINRLLREQTTAPVPEVLAVDVSYRDWPWRYLVMTHEPGQPLASLWPHLGPNDVGAVHRQMGEVVAALHTLQFRAFGEVGADGTVLEGAPYPRALLSRAKRRIAAPHHREIFAEVLAKREAAFGSVQYAALTHEDLNPTNILLQHDAGSWKLSAIVDFDSAWAGSPESDLARLDLWRGMTSDAFWRAYEERHQLASGYLDRRPVLQLLWCLEYAAPIPEHLADTAGVCRELGILPISF